MIQMNYLKKKFSILLVSILLLSIGCSTKYYVKKGMFNEAVKKCVVKLRKNPDDTKHLNYLKEAYPRANEQELSQIKSLKTKGSPDIWDNVFVLYKSLQNRTNLMKTLPTKALNEFYLQDYTGDIENARKKAADYHYTKGIGLLKNKDRESARMAYNEFLQVKSYFTDYKDVNALINKAQSQGTAIAYVELKSGMPAPVPPIIKQEIDKIPLPNEKWVYFTRKKENYYDYFVKININTIDISAESVKEKQYIDSKKVEDGWEYVLDANGNVMKDSLGNDIKQKKYKTITCIVNEVMLNKGIVIVGNIQFFNQISGKLLRTVPVNVENAFSYGYATANGDFDALSEASRKKLNNKPMPFPNDMEMMQMITPIYAKHIEEALYNNRRVFK